MSYKYDEPNTRRQVANFSVDEWIEFRERLNKLIELNMISERDQKILTEIIVNTKTTAQLGYLAKTDPDYNWLQSNQNKPMSTRRIQQILTDYFPEFHIHTTHKKNHKNQKLRNEQNQMRKVLITPESHCCMCGSQEKLEIHHMFPVVMEGNNDARNCIILCHNCHNQVTLFYREQLKELKDKGILNLAQ